MAKEKRFNFWFRTKRTDNTTSIIFLLLGLVMLIFSFRAFMFDGYGWAKFFSWVFCFLYAVFSGLCLFGAFFADGGWCNPEKRLTHIELKQDKVGDLWAV